MNAAQRGARAGRNLLVALLIGAVIIVAIVIAYVVGRSGGSPVAVPTSTTETTVTATETSTAETDAAPTGCLGGSTHDVDMLLTVQKSAPHSAFGAVEMAASFFRWAYRYPYPSSAESRQVSQRVVAASAATSFKDIAGSYASAGDITNGEVPKGDPFYISTVDGLWLVKAGSTADRVTIDLNGSYVINGVLSPTKTAAISATMEWNSGAWHVLSEQPPDTSMLSSGGTHFTAGC